jgi:hypothetical protein
MEVSGAVRHIYMTLGGKRLRSNPFFGLYNVFVRIQSSAFVLYQIIGKSATETYQLIWTILGDETIDGLKGFKRLCITSLKLAYCFHGVYLSVCPSAHIYQLGSHETACRCIWYWRLSIQFTYKHNNNYRVIFFMSNCVYILLGHPVFQGIPALKRLTFWLV